MSLQEKYSSVVSAAQTAGISDLKVQEQDGILYISGTTSSNAGKDAVWNALGAIDATYSASGYQYRCTSSWFSCRHFTYCRYRKF